MSAIGQHRLTARFPVFAPLAGTLIGALGGAVYWLSAQVWPSNVAVILCMAITALLAARIGMASGFMGMAGGFICLLIKYNALMALSAAQLPFAAPANLALGLIMICGHAASFALVVAIRATRPEKSSAKVSGIDLSIALLLGFAPAALLGIPGLIGAATALITGMGFIAYLKIKRASGTSEILGLIQVFGELSFYLGALASWRYV